MEGLKEIIYFCREKFRWAGFGCLQKI